MAVRSFTEWARANLDLAGTFAVVIANEDDAEVPDDRVDRFVLRVEVDDTDGEVCVYASETDEVPAAPVALAQFLETLDALPEACAGYTLVESIQFDLELDDPEIRFGRIDRGIRGALLDRAQRRVCLLVKPPDPDAFGTDTDAPDAADGES
jgi:hypothetical protein